MKKTHVYLLYTLIALTVSCTQNRVPKLPEKTEASLFTIKDLENSEFKIKLTQSEFTAKTQKSSPDSEKKQFQPTSGSENQKIVESHNANSKMEFLFQDLKIKQDPNELNVKIKISKDYLTAFKVINKTTEKTSITDIEQALALQSDNQIWIPIFKFKIDDYGVIEQSKDSSGHKTQLLELKKSNWSSATHVVIDPRPENRLMIDLTSQSYPPLANVFTLNRVNNKVFTRKQLQEIFELDFSMLALYPVESQFLVRVYGSQLQIKLLATKSSSWLTPQESKNLKSLEACNSKQLTEANPSNNTISLADCILLDRGSVEIFFTQPKLKVTADNSDSTQEIEFENSLQAINSNYIKIEKNQIIRPPQLPQEFSDLIALKNIDKKEFLFRRTIEDASNSLIIANGESGVTEIVKFALANEQLSIRRVDSLFSSAYTKEIDTEELMSFPVKYFQFTKVDEKGSPLAVPKLVESNRLNAEFVKIDFKHNKIPITSSPLMYLEGGSCFASINNVDVNENDLDNNLNEGNLNFSYAYSVSLVPNCISDYPTVSNYWTSAFQATHNVKERISLMSYVPHQDNNYNMPFYAQRKLKFGAFTIANRKYDQYGHYGSDGTEEAHPMLHDIKNGKKIIYTLGGLSADNPRKAQIIQAAKEVISNWNITLKNALKGSNLERTDDVIELKIDGVDSEPGHLGDLNKNYIWIVEKPVEGGTIGVAQPAANPRTGYIEATNVIIYNGPLLSQVGQFHKSQEKFKKHDDFLLKLINETKAELEKENAQVSLPDSTEDQTESSNPAKPEVAADSISQMTFLPQDLLTDKISNSRLMLKNPKGATKLLFANLAKIEQLNTNSKFHFNSKTNVNLKSLQKISNPISNYESAWNKLTNKNMLYEIYKRASKENAWQNYDQLKIIASEVFYNKNVQKFSIEQSQQLATQIVKMKLRSQLKQKILASSPSCALDFSDESFNQSIYSNVDELYFNTFKHILAHEVGHSLGLTHNFIASTDKANFEDRAYSSVMDYSNTSQFQHKGAGSYDLHALRAIYTQRIEGEDDHLISLDEILKASNSKTWTEFMRISDEEFSNLKLKPFRYCTDRDLGTDLKCNVWDAGTTAKEITQNNIKEHMQLYRFANGTNDKLNFSWVDTGNYIARVLQHLQPLRKTLDGYFFELITKGSDSVEAEDYNYAAQQAYMYLLSVVGTPDTDEPYESEARFSVVMKDLSPEEFKSTDPRFTQILKEASTDDSGKPIINEIPVKLQVVEAKALADHFISDTDGRLNTRGFLYDKAAAQLILGNREHLASRFQTDSSFPFSFIEFEKINGTKDSLILDMLTDSIKGGNKPATFDFHTGLTLLPNSNYHAPSSMFATQIAEQIAIFGLAPSNADMISGVNNYLFRIGSHEGNHPTSALAINKIEETKNSSSGFHYYQTDGAVISNKLIEDLFTKRELLEAPDEIVQLVATGAALLIDVIADFNERGLPVDKLMSGGVAGALKVEPTNQKLKSAVEFFDKNNEKLQNFFIQSHLPEENVKNTRKLFEVMSSMIASIKYAVLNLVLQQSELKDRLSKLTNNPVQEKMELTLQVQKIGEQINNILRAQISAEIQFPPFILAQRAMHLLDTKVINLDTLASSIQKDNFKTYIEAEGMRAWVIDYKTKNTSATKEELTGALQKLNKEQLYKIGVATLGEKTINDIQSTQDTVKTTALNNFVKLTESFAKDTNSFKASWSRQFRIIQDLSNMFQLATVEAQK
jgi:hypothetical protein